jgi:hypothetical protein
LLDTEHRQVVAWCVLLNIWLVGSTTQGVSRIIAWLALAVPPSLVGH